MFKIHFLYLNILKLYLYPDIFYKIFPFHFCFRHILLENQKRIFSFLFYFNLDFLIRGYVLNLLLHIHLQILNEIKLPNFHYLILLHFLIFHLENLKFNIFVFIVILIIFYFQWYKKKHQLLFCYYMMIFLKFTLNFT